MQFARICSAEPEAGSCFIYFSSNKSTCIFLFLPPQTVKPNVDMCSFINLMLTTKDNIPTSLDHRHMFIISGESWTAHVISLLGVYIIYLYTI